MTSKIVKSPRVSICIPTYNGREHLKDCLDSVRSQTFQDFEVLICDDQSPDGTLDYARELVQDDERFRLIKNPRRFGLVGNWNNCIRQSRGEWIKFVFQDDIIAPTCVEKLLQACERNGKAFSFCARDFLFDDQVSESMRSWPIKHKQRLQSDYGSSPVVDPKFAARSAVKEAIHNLVGEPTVTLINKSVFRELGFFDEALIQLCDAEFWMRVMVSQGVVYVPESLAVFRIHAKATTALNHGARAYRMWVLDPLVLRYRFAFDNRFKPLRNPQITNKSVLSVRMECASAAAHAWKQAQLDGAAEDRSSYSAFKEWNSVISHCKGLKLAANLGRLVNFLERLKSLGVRKTPDAQ